MGYSAEIACPQCGAPVEFYETDHLILCPYCNVKNFLASPLFHFMMPAKDLGTDDLVFVPYLRFKGAVYSCSKKGVSFRIADLTQRGVPIKALPISLGVRPQAVKLTFLGQEQGRFLKNYTSAKEAVATVASQMSQKSEDIKHLAYIGETISRIYLPIAVKNSRAFDGVSGKLIGSLPSDKDIFTPALDNGSRWQPDFIATLCPKCGWNLDGEGDSIVLTCRQCDTAWRAGKTGFNPVDLEVMPGPDAILFLPFWKVKLSFSGADIHTFADFIKVTNQPMIIQKEWHKQDLFFWTPAFKIRPKIYLQLSKQLTIFQKEFDKCEKLPDRMHPVTLPIQEAAESLLVILTHSACKKKDIMAILPELKVRVLNFSLVLLPFTESAHDLVMTPFRLSINRKTLEHGRKL